MVEKLFKHLLFCRVVKTEKTFTYDVSSLHSGDYLGRIKWYGGWRQYVFEPMYDTRWSSDCLSELSFFIKMLMDARKQKKLLKGDAF